MQKMLEPSETMQAVCAVRVDNASAIGEDKIAKGIISSLVNARKFRDDLDLMSHGNFTRTIIMRSLFFSNALKEHENNFQQLVILCSGLDFRFLTYSGWRNAPVFWLDHPASLELTKSLTSNYTNELAKTKMLPIDLLQTDSQSLANLLKTNGFDFTLSTLFLWEGATYYFVPEKVYKILQSVSALCNKNHLVVDFANEGSFMQKMQQSGSQNKTPQLSEEELQGVTKSMELLKKKREPWYGFFNAKDVELQLRNFGYTEVQTVWDSELEKSCFGDAKMVPESMFYVRAGKM